MFLKALPFSCYSRFQAIHIQIQLALHLQSYTKHQIFQFESMLSSQGAKELRKLKMLIND